MGKQKPLIKWPGGKSGEIAQIRRFVPSFDRYVEPFVGGYLACGVGGKVKDYGAREAFSSFDDRYGANFKRFDGGVRVGCGLAWEMLYAEAGYDFGLSNIGDNAFDDTHNGAFFLNVGVNF